MDETAKVLVGFAAGYVGIQLITFLGYLIFDWIRDRRDGWR